MNNINNDLINRQQAIDALNMQAEEMSHWSERYQEQRRGVLTAVNIIVDCPSVQPERKTGRWIPDNTDYYRTKFICSVCGESEEVPTTGFGYGTMWGYCPNCGADMKGDKHETN